MPLISVIIPVFNNEETIKETIESVLNQTFLDLELIVMDDGSQDSSLDIISSIEDPRLKVFSHANAGLSINRNRGFSHASGKFISFLDGDDLWTPDKLEAQLEALEANPQAAVAYSWVDYIDESSKFSRPGTHMTADGNIYEKMLTQNILQNGSNPLIRRQALVEVGGFNQECFLVADWDMWLRLAARYEFITVPRPQILYRTYSTSMSANVLGMEVSGLQVIEEAFNQAPQSLQHLKKRSIASLYHYLTFRTVEAPLAQQNGLTAARFFWHSIRNDFSMWQWKTAMIAVFKIVVVTLLPLRQSQVIITASKRIWAKCLTLLN